MNWLWSILESGDDSSSEEMLDQLKSDFLRIRETLQHAVRVTQPVDADDLGKFPDLTETLKVALEAVAGDWRRVWYRPSLGFESSIDHVESVIMGGLHSPAFLWGEPVLHPAHPGHWPTLPLTWQAASARILTADRMQGDVAEWIPFLEQIGTANQPLVCVTSKIARELLEVFIVNELRGTLHVAVIQGVETGDFDTQLKNGEAPDAQLAKSLPTASVFARRTASTLTADADSILEAPLTNCVWVNVGGSHYEDQQHRLKALACVIAQQTE